MNRTMTLVTGACALMLGAAVGAAPLADAERSAILGNVDGLAPQMDKAAIDIWNFAEVGFHETKSSALLQAQLKAAGFTMEAGVAGMPTAFVARYRSGAGPVIGILAEFDALPGMAQEAVPARKAIAGQAAGHACGHNLFGAASVTAAIAVKRWMVANRVQGEIRLYGAPAEEGGSGKVFMVRSGLMKDVGAMLHWHANDRNGASQTHSLATISGRFRFTGIAAHAAAGPERGRSALDGVEAMDMMVNMMREHVPQDARIHYIITDGGKAVNIVPETAEVSYTVRHPDQKIVAELMARVQRAAEGAAMGTGTTVAFTRTAGTFDLLPNDVLGKLVHANLTTVGGVTYDAADEAFATKVRATLPQNGRTVGPEAIMPYSSGEISYASTDVGDVSYNVPTAGMTAATWVAGTIPHSWQAVAADGNAIGLKGAAVAAKTLALSAAELMRSPETVTAAKAELDERRGKDFVYTPLIGDAPPVLDYQLRKGD